MNPSDAASALTIDAFRRLIERGIPVKCVDARNTVGSAWTPMTIPGAIRLRHESNREIDALPRDRHLVVYGSGGDDARVAALARFLLTHGFNASYLCGGFDAWVTAGFPVMKGDAERPTRY